MNLMEYISHAMEILSGKHLSQREIGFCRERKRKSILFGVMCYSVDGATLRVDTYTRSLDGLPKCHEIMHYNAAGKFLYSTIDPEFRQDAKTA